MLAPVGKTIGERTRAAIAAARETGQAELGQMRPDQDRGADRRSAGSSKAWSSVAQNVGTAAAKSAADQG